MQVIEKDLFGLWEFPNERHDAFTLCLVGQLLEVVGENELALDRIEYLLSVPGELTVETLRLDPMFDGLRDEPRFQALVE